MRVECKSAGGEAAAPSDPPRARGSAARLAAALVTLTDGHGVVTDHRQRAWASVTFSGMRHEIALEFQGEEAVTAAERLVTMLPEYEFAIPRYLVADAAVISVDHTLVPVPRLIVGCEVLMLDDT